MTDVVQGVGRQCEVLGAADLEERPLAGVERAPMVDEAGLDLGVVEGEGAAVGPGGHQDPGLLEALPEGRHPVGEPTGVELEEGARLGVGPAGATAEHLGVAVGRVDGAAGEDVRAPHELRRQASGAA